MKIAISASGNNKDAQFNPRFGRCDNFVVIDTQNDTVDGFANPAFDAPGGAGPQAVQFIAEKGVEVIISGRYGPSAYIALEAAGIKAYIANGGTAGEILQQFLDGELEQVNSANSPGMHGGGRLLE